MGAGDLERVLSVPGRLAAACTNLALAWPHGGTGLGVVTRARVRNRRRFEPVFVEDRRRPVDVVDLGEQWTLEARLRDFDSDAIQRVFPASLLGATAGRRGPRYPASFVPGALMGAASGVVVVFTPDDQAAHPGVVFYRAVPLTADAAVLAFGPEEQLAVDLLFLAIDDASSRIVDVNLLEDLTI